MWHKCECSFLRFILIGVFAQFQQVFNIVSVYFAYENENRSVFTKTFVQNLQILNKKMTFFINYQQSTCKNLQSMLQYD